MTYSALPLPSRLIAATIALAAALTIGLATTPDGARAAQATCPATFHVLHDDRVGKLKLAAGHYEITIIDDARLSCSAASDLFRQFLEDYDGKLPKPWKVRARRSEFVQKDTSVGFRVKRVGSSSGGGGGGRHPASGTSCPNYFHVLHNDQIGKLKLPEGEYRITLIAAGRLTCERASELFSKFLQDWDGDLPGRWRVDVPTATFSKSRRIGFRVKQAEGPAPNPNHGGRHPGRGEERCPGTFRVQHNDRIGKLKLPEGNYRLTLLQKKGLTCQRASKLFTKFLEDFDGDLPGRWRVDSQSGEFRKGRDGKGFRVKLVR